MIVALALLVLQQTDATVVWDTTPPAAAEAPAVKPDHTVPEWGVADPFGYERARCSPLVRGDAPLEVCQAQVRGQLALALGDALPEALRPAGMAGDCQMMRASAGGSAYAVQCGAPSSAPTASRAPKDMDCRPRPVQGGFSSECRPVESPSDKGLSLRLWGDGAD